MEDSSDGSDKNDTSYGVSSSKIQEYKDFCQKQKISKMENHPVNPPEDILEIQVLEVEGFLRNHTSLRDGVVMRFNKTRERLMFAAQRLGEELDFQYFALPTRVGTHRLICSITEMANKLRFGMPMTDLYVTFKTPEECSYFYDEWLEHNTSLRNAEQDVGFDDQRSSSSSDPPQNH